MLRYGFTKEDVDRDEPHFRAETPEDLDIAAKLSGFESGLEMIEELRAEENWMYEGWVFFVGETIGYGYRVYIEDDDNMQPETLTAEEFVKQYIGADSVEEAIESFKE